MLAGRKVESVSLPDQRLPKRERLHRKTDFSQLRKQGSRRASQHIVLLYQTDVHRRSFGIAVGRRVGGAVERSLIRRRIRESYRRNRQYLGMALMLFIARPGITGVTQQALDGEIRLLLQRAGLWKEGTC